MSVPQNRQGRVITFYSFKGGTGRSMALANFAWILAQNRKKVLMIDWDLEAPGLHRYFYPFLPDKDLQSTTGVIDIVLKVAMASTVPDNAKKEDWYLKYADITQYPVDVGFPFPRGGALHFIPAGRQDAQYSTRITSFDWGAFYTKMGGGGFFEELRASMCREYDYVLIDSRTGVTDTAGICTVQLPDSLVVCFTLNNQSIEGAAGIARAVQELRQSFPVSRSLQIFPAAMRVERGELERLKRAREFYREKFDLFLEASSEREYQDYWNDAEIATAPFYSFEEIPACFAERDGVEKSLLRDYEKLLKQVVGKDYRFPRLEQITLDAVVKKFARNSLAVRKLETFYQKLGPDQQNTLESVFLRLVQIPPQGIDTHYLPAFFPPSEFAPEQKQLADALRQQGLIDAAPDGMVKFVSVLNVEEWETGSEWVISRRDWVLERQRLREVMERWDASNRNPTGLLQGEVLKLAADRVATDPDFFSDREKAFVAASREEADASNRRRAELEAAEITGWAKSRLQTEPNEAARLAVTALVRAPNPEAQEILTRALKRRGASRDFGEHASGIAYATFSPDEKQVALAGLDGLISIWEVSGSEPKRIAILEHSDCVMGLAYHPSGQKLFSGSWDKTIVLWDLAGGKAELRFRVEESDAVSDIALVKLPGEGNEPTCVVTAMRGGRVVMRSYDNLDQFNAISVKAPLNSMFVDPSGEWIAFCSGRSHHDSSGRSGLQLLRTADLGHSVPRLLEADGVTGLQWADFNFDSSLVVVSGFGPEVSIFRLWGGGLMLERKINVGSAPVYSASFSPDGKTIVTAAENGKVQRWDVVSGKETGQALNHPRGVGYARYNRRETQLLTASFDGKARLWDLGAEGQIETLSMGELVGLAVAADVQPLDPMELDRFRTAPRKWILVIGTASIHLEPRLGAIAQDLGGALAGANFGMLTAGRPGVDHVAARGFQLVLKAQRRSVENYLSQIISETRKPDFPGGRTVVAKTDTEAMRKAVEMCDAAILVGGREGGAGADMLRLVAEAGKPVLPLAQSGGAARKLFEEAKAASNSRLRLDQWETLEQIGQSNVSDIVQLLNELLADTPSTEHQSIDLGALAWEAGTKIAAEVVWSAVRNFLPRL